MPTEHDPFAPHRTVSRADAPGADDFPEARLVRAGVDEEHIDRLRAWFDGADRDARHAWREDVRSAPDQALTGRLSTPEGMDLGDLTKDQLENLLRHRSLPITGNKPDLIARLTEEAPSEPAGAPEDGAEGGEPQGGENEPEGQPGGQGGPPPNELPTTPEPVTGAGQPPQPGQEEEGTPQGQPGAPAEPPHGDPVTAPSTPDAPQTADPAKAAPIHGPRRSTTHRAGGTGRGQ